MSSLEDAGLDKWLAEVRAEYWSRLGEVASEGDVSGASHVVFELAGRRFALRAPLCKGVVRKPRTIRLPGLPAHSLGVAGIRGEVVSVVDPLIFLHTPGSRPAGAGYLLIVASGVVKAALWVDRVADVVTFSDEEILEVESPWSGLPGGVLLGQVPGDECPTFVLDGVRFLEASAVGERGP